MSARNESSGRFDSKAKLSALWAVVALNFVYGDVFTLLGKQNTNLTSDSLLVAAIFVETAIIMVIVSRVLKQRVNSWVNIVVGALNFVVTLASLISGLTAGTQASYNIFFAITEMVFLLLIIWYAWAWRNTE